MRIGVISDSHAQVLEDLSPELIRALSTVDLIIHCGDFVGITILEGLRGLGEVRAVRGNMDYPEIKEMLPESDVILIEGKRIGIIHGWGSPWGMEYKIREKFRDIDAILFGHTHQPKNEVADGVLYFNPGPAKHSYGILTVENEIKGEIIRV
jgi:uncharacterized protein